MGQTGVAKTGGDGQKNRQAQKLSVITFKPLEMNDIKKLMKCQQLYMKFKVKGSTSGAVNDLAWKSVRVSENK